MFGLATHSSPGNFTRAAESDGSTMVEGVRMKRALIATLAGLAAFFLGTAGPDQAGHGLTLGQSAFAQDMTFDLEEGEGAADDSGGGDDGMVFSEDEATTEGAAEGGEGGEGVDLGDDLLAGIGGDEDDLGMGEDQPRERSTETAEEIYAVQQIYALRINRFELGGSAAFTMNDPFVSHPAAALSLNYWWTNVLAIGLNVLWYQGLENESDLNFFVRRSTRLAVPITEYQLGAHLNFTYVPLYGKFKMFDEFIFQWDSYIVGGVGMMRTRPVPVVDPEVRAFDFSERIAFNAGIGIRIFLSRYLSVFAELRDYIYLEQLENLDVAIGEGPCDGSGQYRNCEDTWLADSSELTNNVTAHLGLTLFLPTSFEYRLPK